MAWIIVLSVANLINLVSAVVILARSSVVSGLAKAMAVLTPILLGTITCLAAAYRCPLLYLLYVLFGQFCSTVLWDSRRFHIESFRWSSLLSVRICYLTSPAVLLFTFVEKPALFHALPIVAVGMFTIIISEVTYNMDKRLQARHSVRPSLLSNHTSAPATPIALREIRIQ